MLLSSTEIGARQESKYRLRPRCKMSILRYTCFISLNRAGNCSVNSADDDDDDDDGDEKHRQE